jgi:tetratricopeptide (TPR) repeat protein
VAHRPSTDRINRADVLLRFYSATDVSGAPRVDTEGRERLSELEANLQRLEPGHPDRAFLLSLIGEAYKMRYIATANARDLDQALEFNKRGVAQAEADDPFRPRLLAHVADARIKRFAATSDTAELRLAASVLREGLQIAPTGHPERVKLLSMLAVTLDALGQYQRDDDVLQEARDVFDALVGETRRDDPRRASILHQFANYLADRYRIDGDRSCLEQATEVLREALQCAHAYDFRIPQYRAKLRELELATA